MPKVQHIGRGLSRIEVSGGNYMADAFAPAEARYKMVVQQCTWGHLAPKPRKKYVGHILFAFGEYGDCVPIRSQFVGLRDSPWFFDDLMEFIGEQCTDARRGQVWRFDGSYTKNLDDTCSFVGELRMIPTGAA